MRGPGHSPDGVPRPGVERSRQVFRPPRMAKCAVTRKGQPRILPMLNLCFARRALVSRCTLVLFIFGVLASNAGAMGSTILPAGEAFQGATGGSPDADTSLREIVAAGRLADLRWPDFSDYRAYVQTFYESSGYSPAWTRGNQATPQALAIIEILKQAGGKPRGNGSGYSQNARQAAVRLFQSKER